ncbi:hypothetical protein L596_024887 [Steinernema carpocapsae]|uniref:Uncharacterized protein n=1 Tax=Steinernema carpocapsae TaxID=34508 RepID=A0A4U5M646_STECR|nr:hypothetical protein L596_024887 [Steinernema carpocapsae]
MGYTPQQKARCVLWYTETRNSKRHSVNPLSETEFLYPFASKLNRLGYLKVHWILNLLFAGRHGENVDRGQFSQAAGCEDVSTTTATVVMGRTESSANLGVPYYMKKLYPYRKLLMLLSVICILVSLLLVLESVLVFGTTNRYYSNPGLMVLSYFLAWVFIVIGLIGVKLSFVVQSYAPRRTITLTRPSSAPAWLEPTIFRPFHRHSIAAVNNPLGLHPPPPPRYSSLSGVLPLGQSNRARSNYARRQQRPLTVAVTPIRLPTMSSAPPPYEPPQPAAQPHQIL